MYISVIYDITMYIGKIGYITNSIDDMNTLINKNFKKTFIYHHTYDDLYELTPILNKQLRENNKYWALQTKGYNFTNAINDMYIDDNIYCIIIYEILDNEFQVQQLIDTINSHNDILHKITRFFNTFLKIFD